jgi:hypothetical protein
VWVERRGVCGLKDVGVWVERRGGVG